MGRKGPYAELLGFEDCRLDHAGPIAWSQLEGPCAAALWWPDATEAMQQHKYHFIAIVLGGKWSEVARRLILAGEIQGMP